MRTMLKATFEITAGNKGIKDGSLPKIIMSIMEKIKPEAAYFLPSEGKRCCIMVFDMKDSSDLPAIVEPLFSGLNAEIQISPVMNAEELKKGLEKL